MHPLLHWFQAAEEASKAAEPHTITYVDFLTVTLTALCALLTALAIIIGLAAIWGYQGIKEALTKTVSEKADAALRKKVKEYPAASEMMELRRRLVEVESIRELLKDHSGKKIDKDEKTSQDGIDGEQPQALAKDYPSDIGA